MSLDAFQCKCQWCLNLKTALLFVLCVLLTVVYSIHVSFILLVESADVIENVFYKLFILFPGSPSKETVLLNNIYHVVK